MCRFAIVYGKIAGLLLSVAAVGWGVFYLLQPWLSSQHLGKTDPELQIIPMSLASKAESSLSNSSIEHDGFIFRLPDKGIATTIGQVTLVGFPNGTLEFPSPLRDEDSLVFAAVHDDDAKRMLGSDMLHSQFKVMQAAMLVTPEQVKWWKFRSSQNRRAALLLLLKFVAITESDTGHLFAIRPIYTIASGEFRGFQLGNPDVPPYEARIDLFDHADRHLAFDIQGGDGHGQVLTQEEINAIVASIRPASDH